MRTFRIHLFAACLLLLGCTDAKIPHQTEWEIKIAAKATPEPTPEPTVVEPTPEPTVESTPTPAPRKKIAPTPEPVRSPVVLTAEQMISEIDKSILGWSRRKVTRDDLEAHVPEIKGFSARLAANPAEAKESYEKIKQGLDGFKIDTGFIAKKVERTLLLLNRTKLSSEKYAEFQGRIERLEKPINEQKYMLVNEELTVLQDEIVDAAKIEETFNKP